MLTVPVPGFDKSIFLREMPFIGERYESASALCVLEVFINSIT
jgi:hypothetical protein